MLYDFDVESDPLTLAQVTLLLASHCPHITCAPGSKKHDMLWFTLAVHHAKASGAHRTAEEAASTSHTPSFLPSPSPSSLPSASLSSLPTQDQRHGALKRLWWCCRLCDVTLPLDAGRALQTWTTKGNANLSNSVLSYGDVAHEIGRSEVAEAQTKRRTFEVMDSTAELFAALVKVIWVIDPETHSPTDADKLSLENCLEELACWYQKSKSYVDDFQHRPSHDAVESCTSQGEPDDSVSDTVQLCIGFMLIHY